MSAKSDLYSLGGVAYYLLTGKHVFTGDNTVAICTQHLHAKPEAPSARLGKPLPPGLDEIVLHCLAKDPDDRPAGAAALAEALQGLGLPAWSEAEAKAWWTAHRPRIETFRRANQRKLNLETGATIDIELADRKRLATPA